MKKILTILILVLMFTTTNAQSTMKGDLNNDGVINISDVVMLVNWVLGVGIPQDSYNICPDEYHPHAIDLALPSGTLWSCCNMDAKTPEGHGGYYAWGETEGKLLYDWSTYIHCDGTSNTCHDLNGEICGTSYDVARMKWDGMWLMPTNMQQRELIENCTYEWTTMNGVRGVMFTGTNDERIFIPAGGNYTESGLSNLGTVGTYWSSQIQPGQSNASILYLKTDYVSSGVVCELYRGLTVRPVVTPYPLLPSTYYLNLFVNMQGVVDIISGYGSYSVESSDEDVATAVVDSTSIIVTAVGGGEAEITVTDNRSEQRIILEVSVKSLPTFASCPDNNHPHAIDLGLPSGTVWACCNVGASLPRDFGDYYAWGETEVKESYTKPNYLYYDNGTQVYVDIGEDICGTEYDVAHVKWGGYWKMPSRAQIYEMVKYCTYSQNTATFTSTINGNSVHLPFAGFYYAGYNNKGMGFKGRNVDGYYWTGTNSSTNNDDAYILGYNKNSSGVNGYNLVIGRENGCPIRPVAK
ncbi:MAG: hypothetical protein IKX33_09265 [Prevotella sp.]|nr:hypothetical protein [Prevotella sp.]